MAARLSPRSVTLSFSLIIKTRQRSAILFHMALLSRSLVKRLMRRHSLACFWNSWTISITTSLTIRQVPGKIGDSMTTLRQALAITVYDYWRIDRNNPAKTGGYIDLNCRMSLYCQPARIAASSFSGLFTLVDIGQSHPLSLAAINHAPRHQSGFRHRSDVPRCPRNVRIEGALEVKYSPRVLSLTLQRLNWFSPARCRRLLPPQCPPLATCGPPRALVCAGVFISISAAAPVRTRRIAKLASSVCRRRRPGRAVPMVGFRWRPGPPRFPSRLLVEVRAVTRKRRPRRSRSFLRLKRSNFFQVPSAGWSAIRTLAFYWRLDVKQHRWRMISFSNRNPASARGISALDRKIPTSRFHHGHREAFCTANALRSGAVGSGYNSIRLLISLRHRCPGRRRSRPDRAPTSGVRKARPSWPPAGPDRSSCRHGGQLDNRIIRA